ncbi:MAG TPA: hypothetical protein VM347_35455 [Nonomuraea sp.]|nr:hypothetical protein [Nonomuraea sp.]
MIPLQAATVLLQWAAGGLLFLWVTSRRREVGLGYGWLLRGIFGTIAAGAAAAGMRLDPSPGRDLLAAATAAAAFAVLALSVVHRRDDKAAVAPAADLLAPVLGFAGLMAASLATPGPLLLGLARTLVGAVFLGAVSDAMLLGHWYLVQPGLTRGPLLELNRWVAYVWPVEVALLLVPIGMVSVFTGAVDDGYGGVLGWFWAACAVTTIALCGVTAAALRERSYSAVMAATGLLYLAILMAFGTDLVARAVLAG